mgnify:CR=1 FL=1
MKKEDTQTRIALLEQNHITLMEKLIEFQKDNKEQHENIIKNLNEMQIKLDKALLKKANKWVETYAIVFLVFIGTGLLGYLGSLLVKAVIHLQ